jgi:integrase
MKGKGIHRLSDLAIRRLRKPGRHGDGGGLALSINPNGAKSWVFVWKRDGRRFVMGLGAVHTITPGKAREIAGLARLALLEGRDPRSARTLFRASGLTFGQVADEYFGKQEAAWSPIHRRQWRQSIAVHAQELRDVPVALIDAKAVLDVIEPLWALHPETASRVRGRIERILDYAAAHGYRSGSNPAKWDQQKYRLPRRKLGFEQRHLAALKIDAVPDLMCKVREIDSIPARCLEFTVLTAARPGEARDAQWPEIDLDSATWTVPRSRMKGRREHRVPLSRRAVEIVREMASVRRSIYIFPGFLDARPLNDSTVNGVLHRLAEGVTVHGFRSTFRDWAAERTDFPAEVVEMALAHVIGNAVEAAYRRGDLFVKRRALMDAWAAFCGQPPADDKVVPLRA